MLRWLRWLFWALLAGASAACTPRLAMPYPAPAAPVLLAGLKADAAARRSVKLKSKVDRVSREGRVKGTVLTLAERPDKLRFDALHPFGGVLSTLTASAGRFRLLDVNKNRLYQGPASPCNVARLLRIALPPEELVTLLLQAVPPPALAPDARPGKVRWDDRAGAFYFDVVLGDRPSGGYRIFVDPGPKRSKGPGARLTLRGVDRYDGRGRRVFEIRYDDVKYEGELSYGREVHFSMPSTGTDLIIRHKTITLNPHIEPGAFTVTAPPGLVPETIDCPQATPIAAPTSSAAAPP